MSYYRTTPVNLSAPHVSQLRRGIQNAKAVVQQMTPDEVKDTLQLSAKYDQAYFATKRQKPFLKALFQRAHKEGLTQRPFGVYPLRGTISDHLGETQKPLQWVYGGSVSGNALARSAAKDSLTSPAQYVTKPTVFHGDADRVIAYGTVNEGLDSQIAKLTQKYGSKA
jgi:malonyl CoA-acyl carrier protein transacylase